MYIMISRNINKCNLFLSLAYPKEKQGRLRTTLPKKNRRLFIAFCISPALKAYGYTKNFKRRWHCFL